MKALVHCADYNGHAAYFIMRKDDPRYGQEYRHIADGKHTRGLFTAKDGRRWRVFEDWSAKPCAS
jgi:hypothetical protein